MGAQATARPTYTSYPTTTPYPTPTPYILSENYPMGSAVYVGSDTGLKLRFQVNAPRIVPVDSQKQIVVWQVEIGNVGTIAYSALPGAQVFVSQLLQNGQVSSGYWYATREAAQVAGIPLDPRVLDIVEVPPNESVDFTLTAFTPLGAVDKIAWILDPYSGGVGQVVGGNTAVWVKRVDEANCVGNVNDTFIIPTPARLSATATASVTPYIPPYSGYSGG